MSGRGEAAGSAGEPTKVLFILGTTRSGSTILENVLGSVPGFFAAGEIHMLWRGMARGFRCACGAPIGECEVWSEILRGAESPQDPMQVDRWQLADARMFHTPRLMRIRSWPVTGRPSLDAYVALLRRLYPEIARVSGAQLIVDSSKTPAAAVILSELEDIDLYVVQLVRDPRGVAYSWARGRPAGPGAHGPRDYNPGSVRTAARWISTNVLGDAVRRRLPPERTMLVRYEDFVSSPRTTVGSIARFVGEEHRDLPFVDEHVARLQPNHCVSGNRSRFAQGDVELRLDDAWKQQRGAARSTVTALTAPLLGRYGYSVRTS